MPLHTILDQLKGLPPALVQIPEMEVQRDEGDACARKLDAAGVPVIAVRCNGMIHDFDLLYVLDQVVGTRGAVGQADQKIKQHLNKRCNPHRGGLVAPVGTFVSLSAFVHQHPLQHSGTACRLRMIITIERSLVTGERLNSVQ